MNTLVALRELNRAHGMFYVLIAVLAAWVAGAFWLLCRDGALELLLGVGLGVLAAGAAVSLGLFAAAAAGTTKRLYA